MSDIMNIDKYDNLFKHLDNRIRNNISLESVTKTDIYDKQMIEVCWSYFIFYIGMKKHFFLQFVYFQRKAEADTNTKSI